MNKLHLSSMYFTAVLQTNDHVTKTLTTEVNGVTNFIKDGKLYLNKANLVGGHNCGFTSPTFICPAEHLAPSGVSDTPFLASLGLSGDEFES